jgi:tyrosine-protein kinase
MDRQILDLRDYLSVLWNRKSTIFWIVLLTTAVAVGYSASRTSVYSSSAEVVVLPVSFAPSDSSSSSFVPINMTTETQIAESFPVKEIAVRDLQVDDIEPGTLSVTQVPDAETLLFTSQAPDAIAAKATAQAYADAYLEYRKTNALDELEGARDPYEQQIQQIDDQISEITDELGGADDAQRVILAGTLSQLNAERISVLTKLNDLIEPENVDVGRVLRAAPFPEAPVSPRPMRDGLVAILVGLALGVGAAFMRDRLEEPVRGRSELETYAGAPVLAFIPSAGDWRRFLKGEGSRAMATADAFRTLRVRFLHIARQQGASVVVVTSALPGEGKTTVTAELGKALAEVGHRVVIVAADLRKPRMDTHFPPRSDGAGLAQLARGTRRATKTLSANKDVKNLWVLHAGRNLGSIDPSEVLASDQIRSALDELREFADFVIVDTPPLLTSPDVFAVGPITDGALLVVDGHLAQQAAIEQSRRELQLVDVPILGLVVNKHDPNRLRAFGTGYGYYIDRSATSEPAPTSPLRAVEPRPRTDPALSGTPGDDVTQHQLADGREREPL